MYYIPCNYVPFNKRTVPKRGVNFRRDNIELSRVKDALSLSGTPNSTKPPGPVIAGKYCPEQKQASRLRARSAPSSLATEGFRMLIEPIVHGNCKSFRHLDLPSMAI
ncbi:hypothetical protein [Xanthomonas nasturtii]|uniref:hypothetical protein n=1 Tax=Xanthomonas nasturtii TaxID=1843581 RepID=UPI002011D0AA|nr:hypothetical protein [Xanthomonas nasturtii]MCL1530982.1 hypothetical protein [Xanthomonas nasturtii]MCL1565789.1 hypothetical protein [Xanthomonas nasturtii]MCL1573391.1 hypothetical protein [Xanthomonas nasturtii]MCL1585053.1 hypothetical protein [Xanthomonas nasturtii]MCL1660746.1 hypothetical protein [Xanthomonas nasturtii]